MDNGGDVNKHVEVESKRSVKADHRTDSSAGGSTACSLCGLTFSSVEEQRNHTRSDLHGYNLKQKLKGQPTVSENEFERLLGGDACRFCLETSAEIP